MKKIRNRSYFAMLIAAALVLGLCIYAVRLYTEGKDWVMLRANQSVFNEGILDTGVLYDRNGVVLAAASNGVFSYSPDPTVRKACLHAVGDYGGNIGTGALSAFDFRLAGYDFVNGVSSLDGCGGRVRLSIDSALNVAAYNALNGRKGAVLVSNYKTGEILCMVSSPSYDPSNPPDLTDKAYEGAFINRCLGAAYTPGSVFKLVTLAAALENIPDIKNRTFSCSGSTVVAGETVRCSGTHGQQTIEQALANSCNVAFSDISQELGADKIYEYAEKFGFFESLNISGINTARGSADKAEKGTSNLSWM
ncbi:MAG: penicillin-binding protein, partial [Clostridiales bacterium]|nr:penicillin-binding protein [Clostridiales bacterium]